MKTQCTKNWAMSVDHLNTTRFREIIWNLVIFNCGAVAHIRSNEPVLNRLYNEPRERYNRWDFNFILTVAAKNTTRKDTAKNMQQNQIVK